MVKRRAYELVIEDLEKEIDQILNGPRKVDFKAVRAVRRIERVINFLKARGMLKRRGK